MIADICDRELFDCQIPNGNKEEEQKMNTGRNFLHYLAQAIDQYRADRRAASAEEAAPQPKRPSRVRRFLRWLAPNGGTLLLVALLILTQNVWARQTSSSATPCTVTPTLPHESTPLNFLISDEEFAASQGQGYVQAFLDDHPGVLGDYHFNNEGHDVSAASAIEFYCELQGINPRVLLTLIELKSHLLSGSPGSPIDAASPLYAMGKYDPDYVGFAAQLRWAVDELSKGFYDRYNGINEEQIVLGDGTVITAPPDMNAATFAIQRFLALDTDREQWESWVSGGPDGFYATYSRLFGAPSADRPHMPASAQGLSDLRLPWGNGETWYYTGGPHRSKNVQYAAVDFAPGGGSGCRSVSQWVRAAKGGRVVYARCNFVRIDHGNGWSTAYFHLSDIRVSVGQWVDAGTPLGHPSCGTGAACGWHGRATGSHVHFNIRRNNIPQPIDGVVIGGWTVHKGSRPYRGTMTMGNVTKHAAWWRKDGYNSIRAYPTDTDTDDGRTLTSGQTLNGTRNPGTDEDIYYINGTAGQVLTVEMWKTSGSSLDTYVYVRDPDNRVIGVDDDGGEGYNSRLVVTLQSSGRFRIHARGYSDSTGAYAIKATLSDSSSGDDEDGHWLSHDQTLNGTLNGNSDEDTYYFSGVSGRIVSIRMWKNGSSVDSYLELYNPQGARVAVNDDGGGDRNSWLVYTLPSSGVYRVKARSYNHASQGNYQIRLRMVDANNLAHGKSVRASSVESGAYMPSKAVDGDLNTRWSSSFNDRQWIYVDLGTDRRVDMVTLRWERAYARRYGVYYWTGSYWRNVYWTDYGNGGTDVVLFSPITARYILVYGYERGTPWGISLWEFGVYNSATATPPTPDDEDPSKTPDSVGEDPPPPATSAGKEEGIMALTLGEDGYQETAPEETTWPGDTPSSNYDEAGVPVAVIENIFFDDTAEMGPDLEYHFIGAAEDTDTEGSGDPIVAYEWRSNLDGLLSNQIEFTTTAQMLSTGVHTITFRAQDNEGIWSQESTWQLTVGNQYSIFLPLIMK